MKHHMSNEAPKSISMEELLDGIQANLPAALQGKPEQETLPLLRNLIPTILNSLSAMGVGLPQFLDERLEQDTGTKLPSDASRLIQECALRLATMQSQTEDNEFSLYTEIIIQEVQTYFQKRLKILPVGVRDGRELSSNAQ